MTPIHHATISQGKLRFERPERWLVALSKLEGKKVELVLRKRRSQRSESQNRYYWGVIVEILASHCGYTSEEMHEALKVKFLGSAHEDERGLIRVRSSAALSIDEFIRYTNEIVRWAAETLGVFIPDPGQMEG